jgi:hypothetical protein
MSLKLLILIFTLHVPGNTKSLKYEINSTGIGEVKLGMKVDEALKLFPGNKKELDTINDDEGGSWTSYQVNVSSKTWISFEYNENTIFSISTNDSNYSTSSGIKVGSSLKYVFNCEKHVDIERDMDDLVIYLPSSHIFLSCNGLKDIDSKLSETNLFNFQNTGKIKYIQSLQPDKLYIDSIKVIDIEYDEEDAN